jgi:hypothetical protein
MIMNNADGAIKIDVILENEGYTVWHVKNGRVSGNHCKNLKLCVEDCLT